MKYRIYIFFLFIFLLCNILYAQESAGPVEVNGDEVEYFPREKKILGVGDISIEYEDAKLTCERIEVFTDTKDAEAEGNVVLKTPSAELEGEKIKYNFETKKGEIFKVRVTSAEWHIGGEKAKLFSDGSVQVEDGYITSCNKDRPHYRIGSKKVLIYPDNKVVAKNVVLKTGAVPLMYLPRYDYSLDTDWPTINMIPGKKKKWGAFALTSYRFDIDKDKKLNLRIDERQKWGLGEGLDYKYFSSDFGEGLLKTYYTHQRDRDRNESFKSEEERYRLQLRHRVDLSESTSALLECHKQSDVDMVKDFFYREEYDRESSPESYLYLLDSQPEYSLSALTRKRVNHFQTITERLPEVRFDLKEQKLSKLPFYFKTDTMFSNLNNKALDASSEDDHLIRFDTYNKLTSPMNLFGFLSASPFVGMRDTFYSRNLNSDESELRSNFYSGIDLSAKFFKTHDVQGSFLGVNFNKLHHIITPTVEYEYIHEPSTTFGKFFQFDDIDSIERKSSFTLGLENRLKTKRLVDGKLTSFDLGYFLLTGDYLYKPENGSQLSNIAGDLQLTPFEWLEISSDTQYDPATRDFQSCNAELYIDKDYWRLGFASRYWQDTEHELTSELFYKVNDEWSFRLFGRYDLKEVESDGNKIINRFSGKEISIMKDLHCWIAEASLDIDRDGGTTFWLALRLKASPKVPFDFKDYYAF